jgi:hypothetical protein
MKIHPAGIPVLAGFGVLMLLAFDLRVAAAVAVATVVLDWLSFGAFFQRRTRNTRVMSHLG